jgi:TonB family protein
MQHRAIRMNRLSRGLIRQAGLLATLALISCAMIAAQVPAAANDKPVIMSDRAIREAARFHVEPEYPAAARQFRVAGEVVAELTVGLDGKVENIAITKGNPLLNASVVVALKKWTFVPFSVDGHPTKVRSVLTFAFKL